MADRSVVGDLVNRDLLGAVGEFDDDLEPIAGVLVLLEEPDAFDFNGSCFIGLYL